MKKTVYVLIFIIIMFFACSDNNNNEKAEKNSAAKTAKQITDKIKDPINKAKAVKKLQEDRAVNIKEVE